MLVIHDLQELKNKIYEFKKENKSIGLVPTMGFLHEGHQSLIEKAVASNDVVIVSDFVNPIQFAPNEDLDSYPRNLEHDAKLCEKANATILFNPKSTDMYLDNAKTYVSVSDLTTNLCGKTRPTHFRGVCTVVAKLFNLVCPNRAYFGQKDAQQVAVIKQMVRDLNFDIEIVVCPIVRESDGLAKSSRNKYLNEEERISALVLNKALNLAQDLIQNNTHDIKTILDAMTSLIEKEQNARIDYVKAVNADTIEDIDSLNDNTLFALAVYIGNTRLIDNFIYRKN